MVSKLGAWSNLSSESQTVWCWLVCMTFTLHLPQPCFTEHFRSNLRLTLDIQPFVQLTWRKPWCNLQSIDFHLALQQNTICDEGKKGNLTTDYNSSHFSNGSILQYVCNSYLPKVSTGTSSKPSNHFLSYLSNRSCHLLCFARRTFNTLAKLLTHLRSFLGATTVSGILQFLKRRSNSTKRWCLGWQGFTTLYRMSRRIFMVLLKAKMDR